MPYFASSAATPIEDGALDTLCYVETLKSQMRLRNIKELATGANSSQETSLKCQS